MSGVLIHVLRTLSLTILAWLFLALNATETFARSCVYMGPLCSRWQDYDAIFDGTATSIRRVDRELEIGDRKVPAADRLVTFKIHDRWRGAEGSEIELLLSGGFGTWTSHSFSVEPGARYLIFARYWNGHYTTSTCDPSAEYGKTGEVLEFLESLRRPPAGGRIFGQIGQASTTFANGASGHHVPPTTLTLRGITGAQSITPRDGRFEFTQLPAGAYSLTVAPVSGLTGDSTQTIYLADRRACAQVDIYFQHDTSISGLLLAPDGRPAAGVNVNLAPARTWRKEVTRTASATTDANGYFQFRAMPPGDYVVGVNIDDNVAYDPYPRTMYVDAAGEPEAVRVDAGQHVGLSPWTIGPALATRRVRLRIVEGGGRPLAHTDVSLRDVTNSEIPDFLQRVMGARTDETGTVEFDVRRSRFYVIERREPGSRDSLRTGVFTADTAESSLTLVLPHR